MVELSKLNVRFDSVSEMLQVLGPNDKYLKILAGLTHVELYAGNNEIQVASQDPRILALLTRLYRILKNLTSRNINFNERDVIYLWSLTESVDDDQILDLFVNRKEIIKTFAGKPVYAKTLHQKRYIDLIEKNTIVLGIGPAGTGKTYLAVLMGLSKLRDGSVKKLILTRPAIRNTWHCNGRYNCVPGDHQKSESRGYMDNLVS